MNKLKSIISRILLFFFLLKIEIKEYPILDILFKNNSIYHIDNADNLTYFIANTLSFKNFNIESFENKDELLDNFIKLANTEKFCIKNKNRAEKILPEFSLVLQILTDAKDAIEKLKLIHRSDKKIAYYESSKNANLDKLIQHFTKKLSLKGEDEISFELARKEVKLKRFITRLKKRHPLFINYQLALFKIYDFNKIIISKEDKQFLNGASKMIEFFTLGHATEQQIYKSVAIQIYFIFKNKLTHTELTEIIGNIIDTVFETELPYKNFEAFNQENAYIKNRVGNFILFELNDDMRTKQTKKIHTYIERNILSQSIYLRLPITKIIIHKMIYNPIHYMLYMEQIKTFGFTPIKK